MQLCNSFVPERSTKLFMLDKHSIRHIHGVENRIIRVIGENAELDPSFFELSRICAS